MSAEDLSRLLEGLSESAQALRKEAESVGQVIDSVQTRLNGMNLGVEVWLEDQPLRTRELSVSASNVAPRIEVQLGFAPLWMHGKEQWCLQLREAEYGPQAISGEGEQFKLSRIHKQQALSECSKPDQVAALSILPALIQKLTTATQEQMRTLRDSKKLLE
ncbi:MAG: hypothetical protein V3T77_10245 [Planctomycetota bacterium]